MIHRYHISLPPQLGMLIKTLVTLEGTARLLSPGFSIMEVMQPFQRRPLLRRLSPATRLRKLRRAYMEFEHLAAVLPRRVIDILEQIQTGKFDVHLDHRGLEPSVNRLVLGMLASALFLGSALMLSQQVPRPALSHARGSWACKTFPSWESAAASLSLLVGLRLLRAIWQVGAP